MPNQYSMFTWYGEVLTEDVVCYKKLAKHFHRCYDVFCDMTKSQWKTAASSGSGQVLHVAWST